ncbi:hydroxysqualene dehydroxylase HpnE [Salinifilum ghardaiensis]
MNRASVLVVGGGLAGITAALRCADRGFAVRLVEGRSLLGGATYSFSRGPLTVDTGQHVLLRCYEHYRALLRRLGVADGVRVQPRLHVPVLSPHRSPVVLRRWNLPAPAHLAPALCANRWLSAGERLRAVRTALALRRLDPDDPRLDAASFGDWLREQGESQRVTDVLWGMLTTAALNARPDDASLALAARVFRTGVLDDTASADIGVPRLPLRELHGDPAARALTAAGVAVHTNTKVRGVFRSGDGLRATTRDRDRHAPLTADHVVLAVPHQQAAALVADLPVRGASRWSALSAAPIINVHVHYDRAVTGHELCSVVDSPLQWIFDRTAASAATTGQYLAVSVSAAWEDAHRRTEEIRARYLSALSEVFPRAAAAGVRDFFVTREPNATFHQTPGTAAHRPAARTAVPGLVLAGAWTATGLPDTLEGAVLSGLRAAEVVEAEQGSRHGVEETA